MRLHSRRAPRALLLVCWLAACGGGGGSDAGVTAPPTGGGSGGGGTGGGGGTTPAGGYTLALSPAAVSIAQNATTTATVTLTRTGTFTGAVTLFVVGLPNGVTAAFNPAQIDAGQTTSTLTLTASATASVGPAAITVTATAAGVASQLAAAQLTVTAASQPGPFTLSLSATSFLAIPTSILSVPPIVTITRNPGFTGPVAFSVTGLPIGLVVAVTPSPNGANTGSVTVLNAGIVAPGTYPVVIHGAAAGLGEQTVTLDVVVAPPTTGSIKWQFCDGTPRAPQWFFAVKDGAGPWTRIVPNGTAYSFNLTQPTAQVALVTSDSGGYRTTIYQATAQEIAALAASECTLYPGATTRTASGAFAGVGGELAYAGMGWWFGSSAGNGGFTLLNLPNGPLDLLGVRASIVTQGATSLIVPDRAILRRGVNPAPGATMPALDFASTEAFALAPATWTFGNTGGQAFSVTQEFLTATGSVGVFSTVPQQDATTTTRTVYGVPAALTVAGDLHQVIASVSTLTKPRATRQIIAYARTLADRAISFGPTMPAPTVSAIAGSPAGRLRAQGTLPAEYAAGVSLDVTQTSTARFATIHATRGFLGGAASYDLQMPDPSAAVGWDTQFALRQGVVADWWVSGGGPSLDVFDARYIFNSTRARWTGALTGITAPADGAVYLMGRAAGTVTP